MNTTRRHTSVAVLLVGLSLVSNVASFIIFAPLFTPGRTLTNADFQRAGLGVGIAVMVIEIIALLLIVGFLRQENVSLKSVVNFQRDKLRAYLITGLIAILPTLLAGCMLKRKYRLVSKATRLV